MNNLFKTFTRHSACLCAALVCLPALAAEPTPSVVAAQVLKTAHSWDGKPIVYPQGTAEVTALKVELQPGAETGWHLHPVPSFAMVLEGTLEVSQRDGSSRQFKAGEVFAEVVNVSHNGRNVGSSPVKLMVVYTGATGAALTHKD